MTINKLFRPLLIFGEYNFVSSNKKKGTLNLE